MKTKIIIAPSIWASAIVNLDYSGLDITERGRLNTWLGFNGLSFSDCLEVLRPRIASLLGYVISWVKKPIATNTLLR